MSNSRESLLRRSKTIFNEIQKLKDAIHYAHSGRPSKVREEERTKKMAKLKKLFAAYDKVTEALERGGHLR